MQYAIQAVASYDSDTLDGFDSSDFALKGEVQSSGGVTVAASSYGPFSSSILDNDGNVGSYASMVIGLDGLAVISYYDAGDEDLKVAHCSNTTCSSSSIFTVDSVGKIGKFTSISIGVDGLLRHSVKGNCPMRTCTTQYAVCRGFIDTAHKA